MSGRQRKVLIEQAEHYGIPFSGRTIDLTRVVKALHDFLAKNARYLAEREQYTSNRRKDPALEKYRAERARIAELKRQKLEGELVSEKEVLEILAEIQQCLRTARSELDAMHGGTAAAVINGVLSSFESVFRLGLAALRTPSRPAESAVPSRGLSDGANASTRRAAEGTGRPGRIRSAGRDGRRSSGRAVLQPSETKARRSGLPSR